MKFGQRIAYAWVAFFLMALYAPLLIIMVFSFNASRYSGQWHGFSLNWYHQMLSDHGLLLAAMHSLVIAIAVGLVTSLLAVMMVFTIQHLRGWKKRIHWQLLLTMLVAPDLCIAAAYTLASYLFHWPHGILTLTTAHVALCLPLAILIQSQQFNRIPPTLFAAAKDLGAGDWHCLLHVVLPLMRASLIASGLLCMVLSLDDAIISYFLTGPDFQTLPVYLLGLIKTGVTPVINAISTLVLLGSVAMILLAQRISGGQHAH